MKIIMFAAVQKEAKHVVMRENGVALVMAKLEDMIVREATDGNDAVIES